MKFHLLAETAIADSNIEKEKSTPNSNSAILQGQQNENTTFFPCFTIKKASSFPWIEDLPHQFLNNV